MKWEAWLLIVLLVALGFVLVYRPGVRTGVTEIQIGQSKAALVELEPAPDGTRRFERAGRLGCSAVGVMGSRRRAVAGEEADRVLAGEARPIFRLLNITSWMSLPWVILGFGAQAIFATRFLIQWIISEKRKESVIPVAFWWVSLVGGVMLFAYFVWRRDAVGVLGQSTGIVIYGRNLRLIHKQRRRLARAQARNEAAAAEAPEADGSDREDAQDAERAGVSKGAAERQGD